MERKSSNERHFVSSNRKFGKCERSIKLKTRRNKVETDGRRPLNSAIGSALYPISQVVTRL